MKTYKSIISLSKNGRGIWDLDTTKGCSSGLNYNSKGCYGDCYAYKTALRYGYDFGKTVLRHFKNESHRVQIVNKIKTIDMPFIRIGCSGDPSENWQHMINILYGLNDNQLNLFPENGKKQIVVITRHWQHLAEYQLNYISKFNLVVNTTISALDSKELITNSLTQYERLKPFCKSVLRIVSCDFNTENEEGRRRLRAQEQFFKNENTIDTVFRPSKNNEFITKGIINVKTGNFMGKKALMSKYNKKTFVGKCASCKEMCGMFL